MAMHREIPEALRLDPEIEEAHSHLGFALGNKGDLEGAIAEYREAASPESEG